MSPLGLHHRTDHYCTVHDRTVLHLHFCTTRAALQARGNSRVRTL